MYDHLLHIIIIRNNSDWCNSPVTAYITPIEMSRTIDCTKIACALTNKMVALKDLSRRCLKCNGRVITCLHRVLDFNDAATKYGKLRAQHSFKLPTNTVSKL